MMNNNHKNSGCGYAEQLVSYLYGETGSAENPAFEIHLETCSICSDELEAFSSVQYSINDWKSKEFSHLETPVIKIPYENPVSLNNRPDTTNVNGSWLSGLRNLFSLNPAWSLATASFAVLAVFAGIGFIAFNSDKGNFVAEGNKTPKPVINPTVERTPETSNTNANQNGSAIKDVKPVNEQKTPLPEVAVAPDTKNNRVVKTQNNPRPAQKAETTNLPKNNDIKRSNKNKTEVPPKIIEDEDEDDTLRLAELFEEIDTVE